MKKAFKKLLAVVLTLAMIVTSITVYNTTAKADGAITLGTPVNNNDGTFSVAITATSDVQYTQIYLKTEDEELHNAQSSDGNWIWNTAPDYQPYLNANQIKGSDDGAVTVADGGTFTLVVRGYSSKEVQDDTTLLGEAETSITMEPYINENTDLNLTVVDKEKGAITNDGPTFNWDLVGGAVNYKVDALKPDGTSARNWTLGETIKTLHYWGSDVTAAAVGNDTYTLRVQALNAENDVIAEDSITDVPAYNPVNTNAELTVTYGTGTATLVWKAITNAVSYKVTVGEDERLVSGTSCTVEVEENVEYVATVQAFDEENNEITITNNTIEVTYVPESAPEEHDIANVDTSSWTLLESKPSGTTFDKTYSISANPGLGTYYYGIYASDNDIPYHEQRTECVISDDVAVFACQESNINVIWVNGDKYNNHSEAFNNQGDCCEISTEILTEQVNLITLVYSDDTAMKTFAIKVEEPLQPDAIETAEQVTIDNASITDWTRLAGTSVDGAMAFISTASGENMGDGGLRGFYDTASASTAWNIDATYGIWDNPVFGFVADNNTSDIVINGTKYVNAKDLRNESVTIAGDCVYIDQSLLTAAAGEEKYYTITATGSQVDTFLLKVVGVKAPTGVTASSPEGGKIRVVWGQDLDMTNAGYHYNVYLDSDTTEPVLTEVVAAEYTINAEAGEHTVIVKSVVKGNESIAATATVTVEEGGSSENPNPTLSDITGLGMDVRTVDGIESVYIAFDTPTGATQYKLYVDGTEYTDRTIYNGIAIPASEFEAGDHEFRLEALNAEGELVANALVQTLAIPEPEVVTYSVKVDGVEVATVEEGETYVFDETEYGYYDVANDIVVASGAEYQVEEDTEFTTITLSFEMTSGASIRMADPSGLRFHTEITATDGLLEQNEDGTGKHVSTGMLITTEDLYNSNEDTLTRESSYTKLDITNTGWFNSIVGSYCGSIVNLNEANYSTEFIAVAYATITYADGTTNTFYSSVSDPRSASAVATSIKNTDNDVDGYYNTLTDEQKEYVDKYITDNGSTEGGIE